MLITTELDTIMIYAAPSEVIIPTLSKEEMISAGNFDADMQWAHDV